MIFGKQFTILKLKYIKKIIMCLFVYCFMLKKIRKICLVFNCFFFFLKNIKNTKILNLKNKKDFSINTFFSVFFCF